MCKTTKSLDETVNQKDVKADDQIDRQVEKEETEEEKETKTVCSICFEEDATLYRSCDLCENKQCGSSLLYALFHI